MITSCIKDEKGDDCPTGNFLTVKALSSSGAEFDSTVVKDVEIYIFDANGKFLEQRSVSLNSPLFLGYPNQSSLTIVALGNSKNNRQTLPILKQGSSLDSAFISLNKTSSALIEGNTTQSPSDLFYGYLKIDNYNKNSNQNYVVNMTRKVASMTVTIKGLQDHFNTTDTDFMISVDGQFSKLDFKGNLQNPEVTSYEPIGAFQSNRDYVVPPFNLLPSSGIHTIKIYKNGKIVYSTTTDKLGNQITSQADRLTNVLIDFTTAPSESGILDVTLVITPWDQVYIWKESN